MRVAVADFGSNSFHLLVADVSSDGGISEILRERDMHGLALTVAREEEIPKGELAAAGATAARFRRLAAGAGAERIEAVATSAFRDASNGMAAVERLGVALGAPVRLISGGEEASLAFLGARAAVAVDPGTGLVLDLGGGSLELAIGGGTVAEWSLTFPLGVMRLMGEAILHDPLTQPEVARIRRRVLTDLAPVRSEVRRAGPRSVVAVGGTVRALGRLVAARRMAWVPTSINQLGIKLADLRTELERLLSLPGSGRLRVPGMSPRRVDQLPVACLVLNTTMEELGVSEIVVSEWGLRQGLALRAVGAQTDTGTAVSSAAVDRLLTTRGCARRADALAAMARLVFEHTAPTHGLGARACDLLCHAARLSSLGGSGTAGGGGWLAARLVESAELRGFAPEEVGVLSTVVRFSTTGRPRMSHHAYGGLDGEHRRLAKRLAAMLATARWVADEGGLVGSDGARLHIEGVAGLAPVADVLAGALGCEITVVHEVIPVPQ